ncbi:heterodisulfide reductase-related iron-sulfur binding cluster [soil metagenome]
MRLNVDDAELASCVSCGLCLPHCPTYRVTGEESAAPRGRIAAMRAVHAGAPADDAFVGFMEACVQCRGCETACPSAVPFGRLMAGTRETLAAAGHSRRWWERLGYRLLGHHRTLLALSSALAVVQRTWAVPRRLGLPVLPVRRRPLSPVAPSVSSGERATPVWLFTGCVMDAWQRPVHAATLRVLAAAGGEVTLPSAGAACCGALAEHAGLGDHARRLADRVIAAFPGQAPVLVNSAGCGAILKDYGRLLGTPEAERFSTRVLDVHEWLADRLDRLPAPPASRPPARVAVQDPCHLRHVQHRHRAVRQVLSPFVDLVDLDDDGVCCGAGGAYSAQQPELAGAIRGRKVASIARSGAGTVASANPGCALHLAAAGLDVRHPMELLDEALALDEGAHVGR